jgi:putative transposase
LHSYLGGISKQLGCAPILTGGMEDHVHLLARFGQTITQADWVKELKRVFNLWLKKEHQIDSLNGKADMPTSRLVSRTSI